MIDIHRLAATVSTAATLAGLGAAATAQSSDPARWLTPTMIEARASMFMPSLNYLTFQHMDQMFATRDVAAGNETWVLPEAPVSLAGDYTILGETFDLEGALEAKERRAPTGSRLGGPGEERAHGLDAALIHGECHVLTQHFRLHRSPAETP